MHPREEVFNFDQCENCGLVFLNPRVEPKELGNYYTEHYLPYRGSDAWGKYKKFVDKSQKDLDLKRAELVNKFHAITADSLVLDVGCGKPTFLEACYDRFNSNVIGIDFSDHGWSGEEARFPNVDLRVGEVEDLPETLDPDVITMWHYLEHDYDPISNLKTLRKVAHNNTSIVIEVPNFDSESRKKFGKNWAGWHTPRHTQLFSPSNIDLLLKSCGWKVRSIMTYGTLDAYTLYWMSRMEKKGIDWTKNMEEEFNGFVMGMITHFPRRVTEKMRSLGIMTIIADAN